MNKILEIYQTLTNLQKVLVLIILATFIYGLSTSISFSLFSNLSKKPSGLVGIKISIPTPSDALVEDPQEPRTEECPLNGRMHTKKALEFWANRRPLAVMIENHTEARPQSGLTSADVIYEAVAEGGITRFMAIYFCNLPDVQIGPVRSARTYFLDWVSEYNALYAHVGGANAPGPADALGQIIRYEILSLNQFSIGFPTYWRDYQRLGHPVATEHTMYSTTHKLWEVGAKRGWVAKDDNGVGWDDNFVSWKFKGDKGEGNISNIVVNFWESQSSYQVQWDWDVSTNKYKRRNGESHLDLNNNEQLTAKNVVIQFQRESNANDGYPGNVHLLYGTIGSGRALIFQDGNVIEGKWTKTSRLGRTKFVDGRGREIAFNRGQIWIQTVPEGSKVTY